MIDSQTKQGPVFCCHGGGSKNLGTEIERNGGEVGVKRKKKPSGVSNLSYNDLHVNDKDLNTHCHILLLLFLTV